MEGSEGDWARRGRLARAMDSLAAAGMPEAIVVMPDGDDGWYTTWNSLASLSGCEARVPPDEPRERYCVPWARYDDYVARDVVAWVDSTFRTRADRAHRGIAGLSMGGYGAVLLAAQYPDVFGAAASHSGALAPALRGGGGRRAPRRSRPRGGRATGATCARCSAATPWGGGRATPRGSSARCAGRVPRSSPRSTSTWAPTTPSSRKTGGSGTRWR
jgi:S-formylglutathione hydrolase FrmB